ncbi:MAG: 2-amino-4-hydroxy-6-hydroxymethyldihydropteridine diphosphokinase [Hyphomonadaceae bacterium]
MPLAAEMFDAEASAIVALGANLPFRALAGSRLLAAALEALAARGFVLQAASGVWESPAWPPSDQPPYVNAAAVFSAKGWTPQTMLAALLETERAFGRERRARWAARTLDLDLVDFAGRRVQEEGLSLPHPRAHERAFVLAPLAEAAPAWRHPVLGRSAAALLAQADRQGLSRLGPLTPQAGAIAKEAPSD